MMKKLFKEYEELKTQEKEIIERKRSIREKFLKSAKYKIGDKVIYNRKFYDEISNPKDGIIREVFPTIHEFSNVLGISYVVAKIRNDGRMHLSQNIEYSRISENWLELKLEYN